VIILDRLGDEIGVAVRYSVKARRVSIKIHSKGAELLLPNDCALNIGAKFLFAKEVWIRQKLQEQENRPLAADGTIPFFGKIYELQYSEGNKATIEIADNIIHISAPLIKQKQTLINFMHRSLLEEIGAITDELKRRYNLHFTSIKISKSKTKWGSCSSKKVLAFNLKLALVPPEILRYVIVHEMCHLAEMNHSKKFWFLVAQLYPDYKSAKTWLKENSNRLYQYF